MEYFDIYLMYAQGAGNFAYFKKCHAYETALELISMPDSLAGYDEIYMGYPNYWGDMPMAIYFFLENFEWNGKMLHPFCTHEGSGLGGTERRIKSVCKGATVTGGLAI